MDNNTTAQDKMVSGADKEENMVDEVDDDTSAKKENNCVFGALLQGEDVGKKALNINEMPEELLLEIFLHLPTQTALKIAAVCSPWASTILSNSFWKRKLSRLGVVLTSDQQKNQNWRLFYALCLENPWDKNLLKNSSGEENRGKVGLGNRTEEDFHTDWFTSWTVWSSGGSGWGLDHFKHKEEDSLCFLTSNHSCSKEQVVQLGRQSSTWWLLDNFQPAITVREFYVAQPDHGAVYEMDVSLLDADRKVIGHFTFRDDVAARSEPSTKRAGHVFRKYGEGARYLRFYHAGMAEDMEEGWWGPRMWGGSVKIDFPEADSVPHSDTGTNG